MAEDDSSMPAADDFEDTTDLGVAMNGDGFAAGVSGTVEESGSTDALPG